jgi:DNA-binding CsgD family transcriptional regulator
MIVMRPKEIYSAIAKAKEQGVSMRRRLVLYWFSMALVVFAVMLLILSIAGVFSAPAQQLQEALSVQERNTASSLTGQMDVLTAQGISLSEEISRELNSLLAARGKSFQDLNDDPAFIAEAEEVLYAPLSRALNTSFCSGAFFCLDATANTQLEGADHSRMGLYLRYSALKAVGPSNQQHIVCFRGAAEVARRAKIQMHNRWNPELDTSQIPGYAQVMSFSGNRLAECCVWTKRIPLRDTWEDVMMLCVPIVDGSGVVRGICGVEISDLYFNLSYPAMSSPYGSMVTVLAPIEGNRILLDEGMLGNPENTYLTAVGTLSVKPGRYYNTYSDGVQSYLGIHQTLPAASADGRPLAVVTLVPTASFDTYAARRRLVWVIGSLVFLGAMLALSAFLSRRFVTPITKSLQAVKEKAPTEEHRSGISEIDALLSSVRTWAEAQMPQGDLPPNIEELFQTFVRRVNTLTRAERRILQYYIDGYTIKEIPAVAFISLSTVKTHNTSINRKLCVNSYDELMLYIDLFRRCGRLEEISNHTVQ